MRNVAKQSTFSGWRFLFKSSAVSASGFKLKKSGDAPTSSPYEGRLHRTPKGKSYALPVFGGLAGLLLALLLLGQFVNSPMWARVQTWPAQVAESWNSPSPKADAPESRDVPAGSVVSEPLRTTCGGSSSSALAIGPGAAVQGLADVVSGPLSKAMALMMLLMGLAIAFVKQSPMSALTGVTGAAFISFGPGVIMTILGCA